MVSEQESFFKTSGGFTLVEMLVVVSITGIISGVVAYYYGDFSNSFASNQARQTFEGDILRSRNEAVSTGARAIFTLDSTGYTVGIDYIPFSAGLTADKTIMRRTLPKGIALTLSQPIIFDSRGYLISSAGSYTSTVCSMTVSGKPFYSKTIYSTGAIQ